MNYSSNTNGIQHKKARKTSADPISDATRAFLSSLLEVLLEKLRWDGDEDPVDLDEDDRAAFEVLRKVSPTGLPGTMQIN